MLVPPRCVVLFSGTVASGSGLGPRLHVAVAQQPPQNAPLTHLFNLLLHAKAVPVADSSSAYRSDHYRQVKQEKRISVHGFSDPSGAGNLGRRGSFVP